MADDERAGPVRARIRADAGMHRLAPSARPIPQDFAVLRPWPRGPSLAGRTHRGDARPDLDPQSHHKERTMPHVTVKMYPGRSEDQKTRLTQAVVDAVTAIVGCAADVVSVAIEEVSPDDWTEKVYKPDILNRRGKLYKEPRYPR